MPYVLKTEMSHEEWLSNRVKYIGASETAAAIGLDKYKTPYDLWKQKTGEAIPNISGINLERTKAGTRAEQMISDWLAEKYSLSIRKDNKIRIHPEMPYWSCNLDRVIISHPSGPGALELKTTSRESLKTWNVNADDPNPIFMHHWVQVQAQMAITGFSWGAIGVMPADSFLGFGEPDLIEITRDDDFIEGMARQVKDFWENYVLTNTPPPPATLTDIISLYPVAGPPPLEVNEDFYNTALKLLQTKKQISALKEFETTLKFQIEMAMKNHDAAVYNGEVILTYKNTKENYFKGDEFLKDFPVEAEECRVVDGKLVKEKYPDYFDKFSEKLVGARQLRLKIKLNKEE